MTYSYRAFGNKEKIGLALGPFLFAATVLVPTPTSMADMAAANSLPQYAPQVALGTMLWMVVWWLTECVPLGITGFVAPIVFTVSGVLPIKDAVQNFADPIIWIFISGFIMAAAFQRWGLDRRVAYSLALLYRGRNPMIATFFVACLPVFILTMTGSITASTTIVFPFVIAFMKILDIPLPAGAPTRSGGKTDGKHEVRSSYAEASFLSLGQAATAGAMLLLISTAPNLVAKATVEEFAPGKTISFADWFVIGAPHAIIGLLVSWAVIFLMIKPEMRALPASREHLRASRESLGGMSREEKTVLSILIAAIFLWVAPSVMRSLGDPDYAGFGALAGFAKAFATNVTEAVPALLIVVAIAVVRPGRKSGPLLKWDEMAKAVDWNIVMLFGGGLALGVGMQASGLAGGIGLGVSSALGEQGATPWAIFAASAAMGFVISYAASNTASAVISCPIAASLAIGAGVDPIPPIIAAGLACSISSAIPSTTPPMAIVYSSGAVRTLNMFKTGMASDLIRFAALIFIGPLLIGLLMP